MTYSKKFNKDRKLRILYVTQNKGFCSYYRLRWPGEEMRKQGMAEIKYTNPSLQQEIVELGTWADVIVFQYSVVPDLIVKICNFVKQNKLPQLICMEFDDNYFNIHPLNASCYMRFGTEEVFIPNPKRQEEKEYFKDGEPFAGLYFEEGDPEGVFNIKDNLKRIEQLKSTLRACDLITCTTPQLAESYAPFGDVAILPNCINPLAMPLNKDNQNKDNRIIISWHGGDSHFADLRKVFPALERIKQKYKNKVHFIFWGAAFLNLYDRVKGELQPWIRPNLFYDHFSKKKIDIGLIPVIKDSFNYGKSAIKWMENSYYSIPSVVANEYPYKPHIKHDRTAMVYNNNEQLYRWLELLIDDPILRIVIAKNARARVLKHYTIQNNADMWYSAYLEALDSKVSKY